MSRFSPTRRPCAGGWSRRSGANECRLRLRLAINTVDAHTGKLVRFVNHDTAFTRAPDYVIVDAITVDMVLASASIPLLFPPVEIGPHLLWDGGLLVNTPLAPVVALGADEIVTVLVTEPPDSIRGPFVHFGRAVGADRRFVSRERLQHRSEAPARAQPRGPHGEQPLSRREPLRGDPPAA